MRGSVTGVLGIDTSGEACRVAFGAVAGRPRNLASVLAAARWREARDRRGHAERIFSLLDRVLGRKGLAPVGLVAVSGGPGSFTGLRVGMAVAKAFARFGNIPLVAVPTLEAMAAEAALRVRAPLYVPVVDAKRGEVYTAPFRLGRDGVVGAGRTAVREPSALRAGLPAGALVVEEPARARTIAALGFLAFAAGERADPDRLVPVYVRRPEAVERMMAKRRDLARRGRVRRPEAVEKMRAGLLKQPRRRRSGRGA